MPLQVNQERARRSRRGRRALIALLVLVAVLVATVAGFAWWLNRTIDTNVKRELVLPTQGPVDDAGSPVAVPPGAGVNVLIVGSDARPGESTARSDVIVLAHLPEDRSAVYLIHLPRDLYVAIPGRGRNKINASYAFGGAPLLIQTVQNLLGIKIDHIAKTDFEGFQAMTDAVGGVRVYAEEASNGTGNGGPVVIRQGWNDLNGEQALAFVRERYQLSEGDISRGRRQMAFIKALMTKAISKDTLTSPARILDLTDAATRNLVVDKGFTTGIMREYAFSLRDVRGRDIVFITAPFSGFGMDPTAGSIDIVDEIRMAELGEHIRNDTLDQWSDVTVTP